MFSLPQSEEKRAAYLKRIKPEFHQAVIDRDNLHKWIAELDGRLPRRDETLHEAASFISSFDPKERKKDKGYKFFGIPYDELNALKDLLSKEHDKMSYSEDLPYDPDDPDDYEKMARNYPLIFGDNNHNPTGIENPADFIHRKDVDNDGDKDIVIENKGE